MRAIWKGAVSFGLVSVPVKLYSATESHDVSFRQVHAKDGGRIKYQRVCAIDGEEVAYADIAKGYETENGEMVILTDEDMAELPLTSSREIAVESFVPSNQIDPMLFEKSYYLEPEKSGAKPYALLRQALIDADRMAVVTVALRQRTSTAVLRVRDDVIVMQTMMWPDEVRQPDFKIETGEIKDAEVKMAHMLVETLAGDFDVEDFKDDYAEAVEELVKAKVEGGEVKKTKTAAKSSGEVVDLLAALQRSVDAAKTARGEETEKEEPKKTGQEGCGEEDRDKEGCREEACQEEGQLGLSANGSVGLEHRLQVAANPRRHGSLSMHGPVQLRPVHGGLKRRCQPFRRAGHQLVGCHGVLNEFTNPGVHRPRAFERVAVEVWLGQIEAKEGHVLAISSGVVPRSAIQSASPRSALTGDRCLARRPSKM